MNIEVEHWGEESPPHPADLRQRLQAEGYSVFQWTDAPGTKYGPHSHPEDQSHWILSGVLELRVGHETYTLRAGDRVIVEKAGRPLEDLVRSGVLRHKKDEGDPRKYSSPEQTAYELAR